MLRLAESADNLAERVVEFYSAWAVPKSDMLTAYSGGGLGMIEVGHPATDYLFSSLMYYPRVVVHDPFAVWFNRDRRRLTIPPLGRVSGKTQRQMTFAEYLIGNEYFAERRDLSETRASVTYMLALIDALRPLIVAGVLVPVPPWRIVRERQQAIASAMRHDLKDDVLFGAVSGPNPEHAPHIQDLIQMGGLEQEGLRPNEARQAAVEAPSFYLNKVLSIADATDSIYVPLGSAGRSS